MARVFLVGVRGVPNRYGGFERLAEVLAPHLARQGHEVTVFCEGGEGDADDLWQGVRRRFLRVAGSGPRATLRYDWQAFGEVPRGAVALIFGYGTGLFQWRLRRRGVSHAVNMDGIEWQRAKWGAGARAWLRINERAAARWADLLIADHPEIARYLRDALGAESTVIAYGVDTDAAARARTAAHPLLGRHAAGGYLLVIARPEPENQIHVLLEAWQRAGRPLPMVVVGRFDANDYGRRLLAAHPQAEFAGAVYDAAVLDALRAGARLYLHGHSVGGTNPSLIEAMAAGAAVVAHDNAFNRWVLGDGGGWFFRGADDLAARLAAPPAPAERERAVAAALARCREQFPWPRILAQYDEVVARLLAAATPAA